MPPSIESARDAIGDRRVSFARIEKGAVEPNNVLQIYDRSVGVRLKLAWDQVAFLLVVWTHVSVVLPGFVDAKPECAAIPEALLYFVDSVQLPLALDTIATPPAEKNGSWKVVPHLVAVAGDKIRLANNGAGPNTIEMAYLMVALNEMTEHTFANTGSLVPESAKDAWKKDPTGLVKTIRPIFAKLHQDVEQWEHMMNSLGAPKDGTASKVVVSRNLV